MAGVAIYSGEKIEDLLAIMEFGRGEWLVHPQEACEEVSSAP